MRAVIQRAEASCVSVNGETVGKIKKGYNILLGISDGDTCAQADLLASKISKLRVFEDDNGKMNLSITDIDGEALVISQFTLCADISHGNRPSFSKAAEPEKANDLYEYFLKRLSLCGVKKVEHGIFGADMKVEILNDGPVTIIMDTDIWSKK